MGRKVLFRHGQSPRNQMIGWVPDPELTAEAALQVARAPLQRIWIDEVGLEWTLRLEFVRPWRMHGAALPPASEAEMSALVFARGSYKRATLVPSQTQLGDCTHAELVALLKDGSPWY